MKHLFATCQLLGLLYVSMCLGLISCQTPTDSASAPPNIVIILADDMGYGDISAIQRTINNCYS